MEGSLNKNHGGVPGGHSTNLPNTIPTTLPGQQMPVLVSNKSYDPESMDLVTHIQQMVINIYIFLTLYPIFQI